MCVFFFNASKLCMLNFMKINSCNAVDTDFSYNPGSKKTRMCVTFQDRRTKLPSRDCIELQKLLEQRLDRKQFQDFGSQ